MNNLMTVKPEGLNIDTEIDPAWAQKKLKNVVIQGGSTKILVKSDQEIFDRATKYIQTFKDMPYIFNLGRSLLENRS